MCHLVRLTGRPQQVLVIANVRRFPGSLQWRIFPDPVNLRAERLPSRESLLLRGRLAYPIGSGNVRRTDCVVSVGPDPITISLGIHRSACAAHYYCGRDRHYTVPILWHPTHDGTGVKDLSFMLGDVLQEFCLVEVSELCFAHV
jgi:hypothetical protein